MLSVNHAVLLQVNALPLEKLQNHGIEDIVNNSDCVIITKYCYYVRKTYKF